MKAEVEPVDRTDLATFIERDPIRAAQLCREQIKADDAGVHVQRRRRLAEAYLIAKRLKADYGLWQRFIADPFFDKDARIRKKDDTRFEYIVTRAVLIYLFSVLKTNNSMRNRVWRYARVIDHYDEKGVPPGQMVEQIKTDGGIEKISAGIGKDLYLEDEHRDWALEMRSRADPDGRMTGDVPEEDDPPEEPPEEPEGVGEPVSVVYIAIDKGLEEYMKRVPNGAQLQLIAIKSKIQNEGKTLLRVSQIEVLSGIMSGYQKAMLEWEEHEKDEGYM